MRIRFSLTLDIRRDRDEPEETDKQGAESHVEHAGTRWYEQETATELGGQDVPIVQSRVARSGETPSGIGFHL